MLTPPSLNASEIIVNPNGSIYHLGLLPHEVSTKIIAVGDPERVPMISRYFDQISIKKMRREFVCHTGTFQGKKLSVISTGMGTDNIEIFLTELALLFFFDLEKRMPLPTRPHVEVVRVGTSGGISTQVALDSLLVSNKAIGLDTLMSFYHFQQTDIALAETVQKALELPFLPYTASPCPILAQRIGAGLAQGLTATAPGFYAPQGRNVFGKANKTALVSQLAAAGITNLEMETAAYYALGHILGIHTLSTNAIVANRALGVFSQQAEKTVEKLILHVLASI